MSALKIGYNSRTIAFLLIIVMGIFFFWNGIINILTWDVMGYNSYLPLIFQKGTFHVGLDYFQKINDTYQNTATLYQYVSLPDGNVFIKYTMGWAILYLPFYSIAEIWANAGGYPNDGFSYPYQFMAFLGTFFYLVLSIVLLRKVLRLFFDEKINATVLLIVGLGTNFFYMFVYAHGLTHNLVFMLVCFFILRTHAFHQKTSIKNAILLGVSVGLIALTRTPSVVIVMFAVFYGYRRYGTIFNKVIFFFKNHFLVIVIAGISAFITFYPQLYYWKSMSGEYLINSYANNPGEGMDWSTPYWINVLFSFKSGWLIYTPMMIFSLIGFYCWIKKDRSTGIGGLLTFLVFFYVVSCWTTWWYPLHFGHRGMFDIYPILAISLGFFFMSFEKKWLYGIVVLLGMLNLFQIYQTRLGVHRGPLMTKEAYFALFFETNPLTEKQNDLREMDPGVIQSAKIDIKKFKLLYEENLHIPDCVLSETTQYAPGMTLILPKIKNVRHLLIRSEWKYEGVNQQLEGKVFNAHMKHGENVYGWKGNQYKDLTVFHDSINKTVIFDYIAPNIRSEKDEFYTGLWAQHGDSIKIKHLNVKVYEWSPR